jgi:hypothetical protein
MPEGSRQSGNIFLNERADVSFFKNKEINQQNEKIKKQLADIAIQLNQKAPTNKQEAEKLLNAYLEETKYIQGQPVMDPKEQKVISEQFKNNPEKFSIYEDGYGKEAVAALTPEERKTFNALTPVSFKLNNGTFMTVYKGSYTDKNGALKQIYLRDLDTIKNKYVDVYANAVGNAMNIYKPSFRKELQNKNSSAAQKLISLNPGTDNPNSKEARKIKDAILSQYLGVTGNFLSDDAFMINDAQTDGSGNIYYTIIKTKDGRSPIKLENITIPNTEQIIFRTDPSGKDIWIVGNISKDTYNAVTDKYIKTKPGQSSFPQKQLTRYVDFKGDE